MNSAPPQPEPGRLRSVAAVDPLRSRSWLEAVSEHALVAYPRECCGILVRASTEPQPRAIRFTNAAAKASGFGFAVPELLRVASVGRQRGEEWVAVYHSHPDAPATLSPADEELGVILPGIAQVILAVARGEVVVRACYSWAYKPAGYQLCSETAIDVVSGVRW